MTKELSIVEYMSSPALQDNIRKTIGDRAPQFITSVASLVNSTPALKTADKQSVMLACLTAASLNLPINQNLGFAYIIPYRDNKKNIMVAQFQMGYKGFIQLAQRTGQFKTLNALEIREGEIERFNFITGEIIFSEEFRKGSEEYFRERQKLPVVGFMSYMELLNGFSKQLYMDHEALKAHGVKYSQNFKKYGSGMWADDFDSMAKKTVLKLLLSKYAPLNSEMQKAQLADQALIKGDGEYEYPDNQQQSIQEQAAEKDRKRLVDHIANADTLENLDECLMGINQVDGDEIYELYKDKKKELTK